MCEYLVMTGYLIPILHCRQWGNIKWKASSRPSVLLLCLPLEGSDDILFPLASVRGRGAGRLSVTKSCPHYNLKTVKRYFSETSYIGKAHSDDVSCTRTTTLTCLFLK